jgi:hypothetical protein
VNRSITQLPFNAPACHLPARQDNVSTHPILSLKASPAVVVADGLPQEKEMIRRPIDRQDYELYGLKEEEIKMVEGG